MIICVSLFKIRSIEFAILRRVFMKKLAFILLIAATFLSGCTNQPVATESSSEDIVEITTEASTGYPSGMVQRPYVMVNDILYVCYVQTTVEPEPTVYSPDEFAKIGEITVRDDQNYPNDNFKSAHVTVGAGVYVNNNEERKEVIFVEEKAGEFEKYVRTEVPEEE